MDLDQAVVKVRAVRTETTELSFFDIPTGQRHCYVRSLFLDDMIQAIFPSLVELKTRGDSLETEISEELIANLILNTRNIELRKDKKVAQLDSIIRELHKTHLREERFDKKAKQRYSYNDTLDYMDGSVRQWLTVILAAERDFLTYNNDINRWENEDYITGRALIFRDDFRIDVGKGSYVEAKKRRNSPTVEDTGRGQYLNLSELLEFLIAAMEAMHLNVSVRMPTVERIRHYMAKTSGDPVLIEKFCREELDIDNEMDFISIFPDEDPPAASPEEPEELVFVGSNLESFEELEDIDEEL